MRHGLGDALFTRTQQKVLGLLFGAPGRTFYANEIVRLAGVGTGAVQRELSRLSAAGLISVRPVGNQKHYQANPESLLFHELRSIVVKTFGVADVIRDVLARIGGEIEVAFIFGSVARGTDSAGSDIDVLIVGNGISYGEISGTLASAEATLGRAISPTIYSPTEIRAKLRARNAFIRKVLEQPKVFLVGSVRELPEPRAPGAER